MPKIQNYDYDYIDEDSFDDVIDYWSDENRKENEKIAKFKRAKEFFSENAFKNPKNKNLRN